MKRFLAVLTTFVALGVGTASAQGFFSGIKDKLTGNEAAEQQQAQQQPAAQQQQVQAQPTPAPAEKSKAGSNSKQSKTAKGTNVKVVEGTPPPQAAQPTPDKATIRKGAARLQKQMATESLPGDIFQRYAGRWKGDFWVYSPGGQLEESKSVAVEYKPSGRNTMTMETFYVDRISKQWVVAETSTYSREGDTVKVTIRRPSNEIATQTGRYNDGALFLTADISDGVEHYRERIDGQKLLVDGFGVYGGKDNHVFIGRFVRER